MRRTKDSRYKVKAVFFDILAECRELKKELSDAGIIVFVPFFGLQMEQTLKGILADTQVSAEQCLLLTNKEQHGKVARSLGMAVAGCVEGHFEVPKNVTLLETPEEVSVHYLDMIYCHMQKLPAVIAETHSCIIREMTEDDFDALYELLADSETAKYLQEKPESKAVEQEKLRSYVHYVYSFFGYGYWGVFSKASGELIGRAGFKEGEYPLEAGYVIKRSEWGKGLATEVLTELVRYAKEELACTEIYATIDENNIASLCVARKCGILCNRLRNNS